MGDKVGPDEQAVSDREIASDTPAKDVRHRLGLVNGSSQDEFTWARFVDHSKWVYSSHSSKLPDASWTKIDPLVRESMIEEVIARYPTEWKERSVDSNLPWKISNWRLALFHMKRKRSKPDRKAHQSPMSEAAEGAAERCAEEGKSKPDPTDKIRGSGHTFFDPVRDGRSEPSGKDL